MSISPLLFFISLIATIPVFSAFVFPQVVVQVQAHPFIAPPNHPNALSARTSVTTTNEEAQQVTMPASIWFQKKISVTAPSRGCHLITKDIEQAIAPELPRISIGLCNLFIQHTSASLTINENADPDVRTDMETALNKLVPAQWNRDGTFRHTMEGDDDMPGHVKSSLMGASLTVPISNGRLALGTWQGIYLNEHRDQGGWGGGHCRSIVITLQGQVN